MPDSQGIDAERGMQPRFRKNDAGSGGYFIPAYRAATEEANHAKHGAGISSGAITPSTIESSFNGSPPHELRS
jgi:hypothetical protein